VPLYERHSVQQKYRIREDLCPYANGPLPPGGGNRPPAHRRAKTIRPQVDANRPNTPFNIDASSEVLEERLALSGKIDSQTSPSACTFSRGEKEIQLLYPLVISPATCAVGGNAADTGRPHNRTNSSRPNAEAKPISTVNPSRSLFRRADSMCDEIGNTTPMRRPAATAPAIPQSNRPG